MKVLEKKLWEEPKSEKDKKVIFLVSDESMKTYNVAIMEAKPIMDLTNAVYLFPYMVSEKKARETFNKIYDKLKN
jgi:hypothetical protein